MEKSGTRVLKLGEFAWHRVATIDVAPAADIALVHCNKFLHQQEQIS
jgi:hypothetical protein